MGTKQHPTYGRRRRYGGGTSIRGHARGHEQVHKPSKVSWECGQTECHPTKFIPGQFKVQMPRNCIRFVRS